jgi:hypothetical protein
MSDVDFENLRQGLLSLLRVTGETLGPRKVPMKLVIVEMTTQLLNLDIGKVRETRHYFAVSDQEHVLFTALAGGVEHGFSVHYSVEIAMDNQLEQVVEG